MLIDARNLTKVYQMGDVKVNALRGVTFTAESGEFIAIMGPLWLGKIHDDGYSRLSRTADRRRILP